MTEKTKRSRLNVRIPTDLLRWAKLWTKKKNTTLTQVLVDHLTSKREEVRARG